MSGSATEEGASSSELILCTERKLTKHEKIFKDVAIWHRQ